MQSTYKVQVLLPAGFTIWITITANSMWAAEQIASAHGKVWQVVFVS